jgi:ubiquinone biosynthesis protein
MEMDLRLEAAALSEFAENTKEDTDFRVPEPDWQLTAREMLVDEWIDGVRLSDVEGLRAAGHDLPELARKIIQSFLKHAIRDGFFHADMHPGNLFVDAEGRLVAVDGGIMGRLGLKERRFLAEILLGFITRDYTRVAQVHFEAGYVPAHHDVADFAQAIRAVGEPIHDKRADQISMAKVLTLLFEITGMFDMATRTELVMLQKTMVVVEGVARSLDPHLDMWGTADPVVRSWITHNLGPIGKLEEAGRGARSLLGSLAALPDTVVRAERVLGQLEDASRHGFALDERSVAAIGRAEAQRNRWGTAALWVIAALVAYGVFG